MKRYYEVPCYEFATSSLAVEITDAKRKIWKTRFCGTGGARTQESASRFSKVRKRCYEPSSRLITVS